MAILFTALLLGTMTEAEKHKILVFPWFAASHTFTMIEGVKLLAQESNMNVSIILPKNSWYLDRLNKTSINPIIIPHYS